MCCSSLTIVDPGDVWIWCADSPTGYGRILAIQCGYVLRRLLHYWGGGCEWMMWIECLVLCRTETQIMHQGVDNFVVAVRLCVCVCSNQWQIRG